MPGPTIIASAEPTSGRTKDLVGDMNTPISVSLTSHLSARKPVQSPVLSLS